MPVNYSAYTTLQHVLDEIFLDQQLSGRVVVISKIDEEMYAQTNSLLSVIQSAHGDNKKEAN